MPVPAVIVRFVVVFDAVRTTTPLPPGSANPADAHALPVWVITPVLETCKQPDEAGSVAGKVNVSEDDGAPGWIMVVFALVELRSNSLPF